MMPPFPSAPAASGQGPPPGGDPWAFERAFKAGQAGLRTASVVTVVGGTMLFFISFMFAIFGFITGSGGVAGVMTLFGILPGVAIIVAGALIAKPGGSPESMANLATVCALLSLLSLGGFLVGAALTFVGAAMARTAARAMPAYPLLQAGAGYAPQGYGATYGGPLPQPQPYSPQAPGYGSPSPPAPAYRQPYPQAPAYGPAPAYFPAPPAMPAPLPPAPAPPAQPWPAQPQSAQAPPEPAWSHRAVAAFLAMDADRAFSLEALNLVDFDRLREEVAAKEADPSKVGEVKAQAARLLARIDQDTADIDTIDDILRDRAVIWYRDSPTDPRWAETRALGWSGLVSESHTAGGARTPALDDRLAQVRDRLSQAPAPSKRGFLAFGKASGGSAEAGGSSIVRPSSSLPARVVQAVLDDMAGTPRKPGASLSLLRLAEVAAKSTAAAVNQTLADLFKGDARGPVVLVHPSRYPGFEFVLIRLPPAAAVGGAIAYEVICAPPDAPLPGPQDAPAGAVVPRIVGGAPVDVSSAVWAGDHLSPSDWGPILSEVERRRERLPAPPSNFRKLPAYFALRKLVLGDAAARRTFLAVKWRGKPPGIGLVAELLDEGTLAPEVDTDGEYLEAELSDIERGDPQWHPSDGRWQVAPALAVVRFEADGAHAYKVA